MELCGLKFTLANIDLDINIPDSLELECRSAELSQVFINLLNNSYYAVISQPVRKISIQAQDQNETRRAWHRLRLNDFPNTCRKPSRPAETSAAGTSNNFHYSITQATIRP